MQLGVRFRGQSGEFGVFLGADLAREAALECAGGEVLGDEVLQTSAMMRKRRALSECLLHGDANR